MAIRAENDPRYWRRFLAMGILAFGGSLWFLKDAIFAYPAKRADEFEKFKTVSKTLFNAEEKKTVTLAEVEAQGNKERADAWNRFAREGEVPTKAEIVTQYVMAALTAAVGLWLISLPIRARRRWIEWDDSE